MMNLMSLYFIYLAVYKDNMFMMSFIVAFFIFQRLETFKHCHTEPSLARERHLPCLKFIDLILFILNLIHHPILLLAGKIHLCCIVPTLYSMVSGTMEGISYFNKIHNTGFMSVSTFDQIEIECWTLLKALCKYKSCYRLM